MPPETEVVDAPPAPAPAAPPAVPPGAPPSAPPVASPEWMATLPEDLRADKTLGKYQTPEAAHKAHVELQKVYGAKTEGTVKLPPADAKLDSPEVVAYRTAAGIPLTVDGYKDVRIPETAGAGPGMSPEGIKAFTENVALPAGMTSGQVQQAVNFLAEWNAQAQTQFREGLIAKQEPLRQKWGANYAREIGLGARAFDMIEAEAGMSKEWRQYLTSTGLHEHPDFVLMGAYLGRSLFEKGIIPGHVEGSLTQDEMRAKRTAIRNDPKHPFNLPGHKGHAAAVEEMEGLLKAEHGTRELTSA